MYWYEKIRDRLQNTVASTKLSGGKGKVKHKCLYMYVWDVYLYARLCLKVPWKGASLETSNSGARVGGGAGKRKRTWEGDFALYRP